MLSFRRILSASPVDIGLAVASREHSEPLQTFDDRPGPFFSSSGHGVAMYVQESGALFSHRPGMMWRCMSRRSGPLFSPYGHGVAMCRRRGPFARRYGVDIHSGELGGLAGKTPKISTPELRKVPTIETPKLLARRKVFRNADARAYRSCCGFVAFYLLPPWTSATP